MISDYEKDTKFVVACRNAGFKPSARQYSKWQNKKGIVYELYKQSTDRLCKMQEKYNGGHPV